MRARVTVAPRMETQLSTVPSAGMDRTLSVRVPRSWRWEVRRAREEPAGAAVETLAAGQGSGERGVAVPLELGARAGDGAARLTYLIAPI